MKVFLVNISLFLVLLGAGVLLVFNLADGSTDAFYVKFTTPKQSSMILGSSRAAQGIIPGIVQEGIADVKLYNYAFSIIHSAYGEIYYKSIDKKLDKENNKGLFLVCVTPWTVSSMTKDPEDTLHFRERGSFLDKTYRVTMNPNIEYLVESFDQKYMDIITNKGKRGEYQTFYTHEDGWLEVTIESDMISRTDRTNNKIEEYQRKLSRYSGCSKVRMRYLKKTISLLKEHGTVYVVRLPVHDKMLELEKQLIPDFDVKISTLSDELNVIYLNMMPLRQNYSYTDGQHLDIESAKEFCKTLNQKIKSTF